MQQPKNKKLSCNFLLGLLSTLRDIMRKLVSVVTIASYVMCQILDRNSRNSSVADNGTSSRFR